MTLEMFAEQPESIVDGEKPRYIGSFRIEELNSKLEITELNSKVTYLKSYKRGRLQGQLNLTKPDEVSFIEGLIRHANNECGEIPGIQCDINIITDVREKFENMIPGLKGVEVVKRVNIKAKKVGERDFVGYRLGASELIESTTL